MNSKDEQIEELKQRLNKLEEERKQQSEALKEKQNETETEETEENEYADQFLSRMEVPKGAPVGATPTSDKNANF